MGGSGIEERRAGPPIRPEMLAQVVVGARLGTLAVPLLGHVGLAEAPGLTGHVPSAATAEGRRQVLVQNGPQEPLCPQVRTQT